ncbi:MAG: acyl-CoA reductase [Flavobacteriales bacterium]
MTKATKSSVPVALDVMVPALVQLGRAMAVWGAEGSWPGHSSGMTEAEFGAVNDAIRRAAGHNGWATEENVRHAFANWARALEKDALMAWVAAYPELSATLSTGRTVGLVLAGNIPLVGLHDVLCVWLAGHKAMVKVSTQEPELLPVLFGMLDRFVPGTLDRITFVKGKWGPVDAVIATGSNNTARYFEHYFKEVPRIIRKSRVSVAVLDGSETSDELGRLGEDVFRYFGLGCRNVAKVLVPEDLDLDRVFEALYPWSAVAHHAKYANNYEYTRALWLLDGVDFLDNGFILLKEDEALPSPMGTLFYERYTDGAQVERFLAEHADAIQCVVGHGYLPFGASQAPAMGDHADGVDTMRFLLDLG